MSTQSIVRVPAGVSDGTRKGGQFATHAHAPADDVELTGESQPLPEWSENELEVDLADALQDWTSKIRSGQVQQATATELLGINDKRAMFTAYGFHRADYLDNITFTATAENYTAFAGNRYEPEEESRRGNLRVKVGFRQIADIDFEEDGPDISGKLLSAAPPVGGPPPEGKKTRAESIREFRRNREAMERTSAPLAPLTRPQ